jgi:hypothetical protein
MQPGERLEVRAELRVNSGEADPCASNHELSKPASHALTEVAALRPELILIAPTVEAGDRSGLRELTMQGHSAGKPMLRQKLRPAPIRGYALEHENVRRRFGRAENLLDHVRHLFLELRGDQEVAPGRAHQAVAHDAANH